MATEQPQILRIRSLAPRDAHLRQIVDVVNEMHATLVNLAERVAALEDARGPEESQ